MQMTPDVEMLEREVEKEKKPKFYSEKSTVQVRNDTVFQGCFSGEKTGPCLEQAMAFSP